MMSSASISTMTSTASTRTPAATAPAPSPARRIIVAAVERFERALALHDELEAAYEAGGDEGVAYFASLACSQMVDCEILLLNALLSTRHVADPTGPRDDHHLRLQRGASFRHGARIYRAVPDRQAGTMVLRIEDADAPNAL
jgi:hypothetical protein